MLAGVFRSSGKDLAVLESVFANQRMDFVMLAGVFRSQRKGFSTVLSELYYLCRYERD